MANKRLTLFNTFVTDFFEYINIKISDGSSMFDK